ncbi:MAG: helix-turn-helix transcriptional regulator [Clostridia bacterium]|nr:helix-turn-helix transcriptional regulator [Clostridia bacterium]
MDTVGIVQSDSLSYPLHYHSSFEVVYCKSGVLTLRGNSDITLKAGEAALISSLIIHGYQSNGAVEYGVIVFDDTVFTDVENISLINTVQEPFVFPSLPEAERIHLEELFDRISQFQKKQDTSLLQMYSKILLTIMVRFATKHVIHDKPVQLETIGILNHILNYIREHSHEETVTLKDIAVAVHVSQYTVSRLIHLYLQTTLPKIRNQYRLQEACRLLTQTKMSVLDISERTGFGCINSFHRNFKQQFFMTPLEYRQRSEGYTFHENQSEPYSYTD